MSNRVGARVGLCPTARPVDAAELCDLVADCDVLHVNSWTRCAKPTFRHGSYSSLIDHVFIRHSLGDSILRREGPVSWLLFKWRQGGYHLLVCASIRRLNVSSLAKSNGARSRVLDRITLEQVCRDPTDTRTHALHTRVGPWLAVHRHSAVEKVNSQLTETALDFFREDATRPNCSMATYSGWSLRPGGVVCLSHLDS